MAHVSRCQGPISAEFVHYSFQFLRSGVVFKKEPGDPAAFCPFSVAVGADDPGARLGNRVLVPPFRQAAFAVFVGACFECDKEVVDAEEVVQSWVLGEFQDFFVCFRGRKSQSLVVSWLPFWQGVFALGFVNLHRDRYLDD